MGDRYDVVRGAVVQAAPVFLDREATVRKACDLIAEAGANGASIIAFPEGYIPAHPIWYEFHTPGSTEGMRFDLELFKNAVEVPGPDVDALGDAAKAAGAYVVMGVCEKAPRSVSNLYNTQLFLGPGGDLIGKHRKLMPTLGERLVHRGGDGDTLGPFETRYGPISGLICGENSNPAALFALADAQTRFHIMNWPNLGSRSRAAMAEKALSRAKAVADITRAFVLSSCGVVDDTVRDGLGVTGADLDFLSEPAAMGGSAIVAPDMTVLAGPLPGPTEGILYADMDVEHIIRMKLRQDYAGHYNRPDVFSLRVDRRSRERYVVDDLPEAGPVSDEGGAGGVVDRSGPPSAD
jgi:aliphatic nitrilase